MPKTWIYNKLSAQHKRGDNSEDHPHVILCALIILHNFYNWVYLFIIKSFSFSWHQSNKHIRRVELLEFCVVSGLGTIFNLFMFLFRFGVVNVFIYFKKLCECKPKTIKHEYEIYCSKNWEALNCIELKMVHGKAKEKLRENMISYGLKTQAV